MRRIKATAARVALTTIVVGGIGVGMAGSATAQEIGTITVNPTTFTTDESAGAGSSSCFNGIVDIYIDGGIWIPNFPADGGGWGFGLVGADIGVGEHQVTASCKNAEGQVQFQYDPAPFTITQGTGTVPTTVEEVPTTVEEIPTTVEEVPTTVEETPTTAPTATTAAATATTAAPATTVGSQSATTLATTTTASGVLAAQALPATGANQERSLAIAIGLLVVGATAVVIGRRRPADA